MSNRMLFPCRRRWTRLAHCLFGPFLLWLSKTKDGQHLFVWLCLHIVVWTVFRPSLKSPAVLHLPLSPLFAKKLVRQLDNNLKGSLGIFQALMSISLWTLTILSGSIFAVIFCCTKQGESLILLVDGVSTCHCGCYLGQEQSFSWIGSLGSTPHLRKAYYNFLSWRDSHV